MAQSTRAHWTIHRLWNGQPADPAEQVELRFEIGHSSLVVDVDAPFHRDPPPAGPRGPQDGLWEHEVVELFLLAEPDHYLEIELGPHGHHWVLELRGRRRVLHSGLPIHYDARLEGQRWLGHAEIAAELVPTDATHGNAYAIHGVGPERRYLAHYPVPGAAPDFHRLESFGPLW